MDRFLDQWRLREARTQGATVDEEEEDDGAEEEDDMANFVVSDEEISSDSEQEDERKEERATPVPLPKRIRLQVKSTAQPRRSPPASNSAAAAPVAAAPTAVPADVRPRTAKPPPRVSGQQKLQLYRGASSSSSAADSSVAAASSARAVAASVCSSQPQRTSATPLLVRATSAPSSSAAASSTSASASPVIPAAVRKRKHLALDDADEATQQRSLVDLIDDLGDDEPTRRVRQRAGDAVDDEAHEEAPPAPVAPRNRNILSVLHAVQSGTLPCASQQFARIERLQREYRSRPVAQADDDASASASFRTVGAASSSAAVAASASLPTDVAMPLYASSHFRSAVVLHHELFHHSHNHLLWNRMRPVLSWSLCGPTEPVPHPVPSVSTAAAEEYYVSSIEFDSQGALFSCVSTNALVHLYDFDSVWMSGRRVEREKRSRAIRTLDAQAKLQEAVRRSKSPPRSRLGWTLNQAAPAARPITAPAAAAHERLAPIFSMDLQASVRSRLADRAPALPPLATLKHIDSQRWNTYNANELAMSSKRNNQIFIFDVSRCDESGSPHRRILARDSSAAPLHSTCVMDFRYFPPTAAHASSHTLVAALRNGDINVMDMRVAPGASSVDAAAQALGAKIHKPQQRAELSAQGSSSGLSNPPCSLQLSSCGQKLFCFTELGQLECWDTRAMRASFDRMHLLDSLWTASNPAAAPSLGLQDRGSRVCSTSVHPQDDFALLFQLLNGAVGLLDLNPTSPAYRSCRTVVPMDPAGGFVTASGDCAVRARRCATFLPSGQTGSSASGGREKLMAVVDTQHQLQIVEACEARACKLTEIADARVKKMTTSSLLQREIQRSSDLCAPTPLAASPSMHVLCTVPSTPSAAFAPAAAGWPELQTDAAMSLTAHPSVPYLLLGHKHQRVRVVTHESELEIEADLEQLVV